MRMPLEWRIQLAQRDHVLDGEVACKSQSEIQRRSLVPARPDDAIAVGPLGNIGIMVSDLEIQGCHNVHHRERSTRVPRSGSTKRYQVIAAHQAGSMFQFRDGELASHGL